MDKKLCTRCKEIKSTTDFCKNKRRRDGYQPACKSCMNVSYNASRQKKRQHYYDVSRKRVLSNVQKIKEWKEVRGCVKCLEKDSACLDFHHIDPLEKEVVIANVAGHWSWKRLQTEIVKCAVLCSNCHRKLHAGRFSIDFLDGQTIINNTNEHEEES